MGRNAGLRFPVSMCSFLEMTLPVIYLSGFPLVEREAEAEIQGESDSGKRRLGLPDRLARQSLPPLDDRCACPVPHVSIRRAAQDRDSDSKSQHARSEPAKLSSPGSEVTPAPARRLPSCEEERVSEPAGWQRRQGSLRPGRLPWLPRCLACRPASRPASASGLAVLPGRLASRSWGPGLQASSYSSGPEDRAPQPISGVVQAAPGKVAGGGAATDVLIGVQRDVILIQGPSVLRHPGNQYNCQQRESLPWLPVPVPSV